MKDSFRVVSDSYNGFECQRKRWWFPVWFEIGTNSFPNINEAKAFIENQGKVYATYVSD